MNHLEKDVIKINVGGTVIMTSKDVLTSVSQSKLDKVFSGELTELKRIDDAIFLDRNGKIFEAMIDYLRDDRVKMPRFSELNDQIRFTNELKFWGMAPYYTSQKPSQTVTLNSGRNSPIFKNTIHLQKNQLFSTVRGGQERTKSTIPQRPNRSPLVKFDSEISYDSHDSDTP